MEGDRPGTGRDHRREHGQAVAAAGVHHHVAPTDVRGQFAGDIGERVIRHGDQNDVSPLDHLGRRERLNTVEQGLDAQLRGH